jgi:hypothetical protein
MGLTALSGYRLPSTDRLRFQFVVDDTALDSLSRRFRQAMYKVDTSRSAGLHPDVLLTEAECTPTTDGKVLITLQFGFGQAIPGVAAIDAYGACDMSEFLWRCRGRPRLRMCPDHAGAPAPSVTVPCVAAFWLDRILNA